jgi:hypothetical protein
MFLPSARRRGVAVLKPNPDNDQHLVASIIDELKRGGLLNEPRRHFSADSPALLDHVRNEVQRSIDRIRQRQTSVLPTFYYAETKHPDGEWVEDQFVELPKRTAADYRTLGRLLRKMGFTALAEQMGASEHVVQEPPPRADALNHCCADEAFFLMQMFSIKDSKGEAFRAIAEMLYEAVTGKEAIKFGMERACDWVLRERRVRER